MKNLMFLSAILLLIVGCNSKTKTETIESTTTVQAVDTTTTDTANVKKPKAEQLYACSMHPEVQGKKGEECSKCGMELTEPVK